jgi:apolipoprotein N-acyltransferase
MLARIFAGGPWFLVHLGLILAVITLVTSTERKFHEHTRYRWFVLQGVVNWVGFEMIRSFIPVLGTMGFVANTQAGQAWLIQPVSIFSIYGLGLIILLTNFALAQVGLALIDRRWPVEDAVPVDVRSTRRWAAGVGIGLAAWIGLSLTILGSAPQNAPTVRVAALQPGFPEPAHIDPGTPQDLRVQTLLALGREAAGQGAKVLFTPELGMAIDPQREYTSDFKALTAETGAYAFYLRIGHASGLSQRSGAPDASGPIPASLRQDSPRTRRAQSHLLRRLSCLRYAVGPPRDRDLHG